MKCQNCSSTEIVVATETKCPKCKSSKIKEYNRGSVLAVGLGVTVLIFAIGFFLAVVNTGLMQVVGFLMVVVSPFLLWNALRVELPRNAKVSKGAPWYNCAESDCSYHWYAEQNICNKCKHYINPTT